MEATPNIEESLRRKREAFYQVKAANQQPEVGFMTVQDVDMTKREVRVVGNAYKFLDSDRDILMPGCAKKSIKERGPDSSAVAKIKYAKDHDLTQIPGVFTQLEETEITYRGQTFECLAGTVKMLRTQLGDDHLISYQEGAIDNHSIGFQYTNLKAVERTSKEFDKIVSELINPKAVDGLNWVFVVKEINLFETSSVAFGANSLTPYLGVKAENHEGKVMKLCRRLDGLNSALKAGIETDDMRHSFELQVRQIKQMITELYATLSAPSEKEKAIGESKKSIPNSSRAASLIKF